MWRSVHPLRTITGGLSTSIMETRLHWKRNLCRWELMPLGATAATVGTNQSFPAMGSYWSRILSLAHSCRWGWWQDEILWPVYTWSHGPKWRRNHWCHHRRSGRGLAVLVSPSSHANIRSWTTHSSRITTHSRARIPETLVYMSVPCCLTRVWTAVNVPLGLFEAWDQSLPHDCSI